VYFGEEQEELIRQYIETRDERLYEKSIDPLLNNIAYGVRSRRNFQPASYYTSPSVINGCKSLMWEKLISNFDISKNAKAFSYLTRIAQNYFCGVARKRKKSIRTLRLVAWEAEAIWESQHGYSRDAESRMLNIDLSNIRTNIVKMFFERSFNISEGTYKKIMKEIECLPNAHKKAVNRVLHKHLWPTIEKGLGTKRLLRAKTKFANEGFVKTY
jgi:hypothetical protein